MKRTLCIAIHDVAPATWPACARMLAMLDRLGAPHVTLLVVPDYHHRGRVDRAAGFRRAIDARISRGDEVALHGYFHLDDSVPPRTPAQWLRRRVLTAGEGEFSDLPEEEAAVRIACGIELFTQLGWAPRGFVAPAWLLGAGARAALARVPLHYTSTHTHLEMLVDRRRIHAPCITVSARSAWRRIASRGWLAVAAAATRDTPLIRVGLHPSDAEHTDVHAAWEAILRSLLSTREPATKSDAIAAASAATPAHRDSLPPPRSADACVSDIESTQGSRRAD
ncbi:MAG: polysaccharide deacetylase family protein [Dokdonella sp.]